jgi:hypothetical protein
MSPTTHHALSAIVLGCLSAVYGVPVANGQAPPREEALRLALPKVEVADQDEDERRLLKERYNAALDEWESLYRLAQIGQITPADPQLHDCMGRVVAAGMELHRRAADRIKLLEEVVRIAKAAEEATETAANVGRASSQERHRSRYYRIDAELLLLRERKRA